MEATRLCSVSGSAHAAAISSARRHELSTQILFSFSGNSVLSKRRSRQSGITAVSKEALEKVQQAISQAQAEEKCKPGIPPPQIDGGPGLINLSGREDLETGRTPFMKPLSAQPLTPPGPSEEQDVTNEPTVSGSEGKESWLLPSPLSPAQRTIVVGMIVLTVVAFGKSSEGRIPDEILGYLQLWMRLAWGGHALLGAGAAFLAAGKRRPPLKWFVKVAASGALGLQELLQLPNRS